MIRTVGNSPESLSFIADFNVPQGWYANAFRLAECVVTAGHVGSADPRIIIPGKTEVGRLNFLRHPERDLAVATYTQSPSGSFLILAESSISHKGKIIGRQVIVKGFHGPNRDAFVIPARIVGVDAKNRIIIESNSRRLTFQQGMSGSVAETNGNVVAGFLVEGVEGQKGSQAYFEPAWALVPYIAGLQLV